MKKKILTICLIVALAATAIIGGTLAYFTDTDKATNVFTTGKVDITLNETFDKENAKLLPGDANAIAKVINVTNNEEDAYVRLHIAFPADTLDYSATEGYYEYNNLVHYNQKYASMVTGEWNWTKTAAGVGGDHPGYPGNGSGYNAYTTTINNTNYVVFVVTYMTRLTKDATTKTDAIFQVYLDKYADTEDGVTYTAPANKAEGGYRTKALSSNLNNYEIYVVAEGAQAEGFDDAYQALDAAFGAPGTYNPWA
ncbi:MAG: TasA family protein [bacterium]|nr:TasA family protein [bacterium]